MYSLAPGIFEYCLISSDQWFQNVHGLPSSLHLQLAVSLVSVATAVSNTPFLAQRSSVFWLTPTAFADCSYDTGRTFLTKHPAPWAWLLQPEEDVGLLFFPRAPKLPSLITPKIPLSRERRGDQDCREDPRAELHCEDVPAWGPGCASDKTLQLPFCLLLPLSSSIFI